MRISDWSSDVCSSDLRGGRKAENLDYYDIVVGLRMALVVVGAFDRQVSVGNVTADNKSLNANLMTMYLAEKMGMPLPELGPDFYAFMSNLTDRKSTRLNSSH